MVRYEDPITCGFKPYDSLETFLKDPRVPRDLKRLVLIARRLLNNKKFDDWLWSHTPSEYTYYSIFDHLKWFSELYKTLGEWE